MKRITLRLTIDVTFEPNGTPVNDLVDNLLDLNARAMRDRLFTCDTDAQVVIAQPNVERLS